MEKVMKTQRCKKKLTTLQQAKMWRKLFRNLGKLFRIKKRHNMVDLPSRINISEV